jgi:hypothetical protein
MAAKCRLLVAVTTLGYVHARRALAADFDLVPAFSLAEALAALEADGIQGVLASIHFDDSRMFDLLTHVKGMKPSPPFICCLLLGTQLSGHSLSALVDAATSQGCLGFFDYNSLQRKVGFPEADRQFREHVLAHLPPPCGVAAAA